MGHNFTFTLHTSGQVKLTDVDRQNTRKHSAERPPESNDQRRLCTTAAIVGCDVTDGEREANGFVCGLHWGKDPVRRQRRHATGIVNCSCQPLSAPLAEWDGRLPTFCARKSIGWFTTMARLLSDAIARLRRDKGPTVKYSPSCALLLLASPCARVRRRSVGLLPAIWDHSLSHSLSCRLDFLRPDGIFRNVSIETRKVFQLTRFFPPTAHHLPTPQPSN